MPKYEIRLQESWVFLHNCYVCILATEFYKASSVLLMVVIIMTPTYLFTKLQKGLSDKITLSTPSPHHHLDFYCVRV